MMMKLQMASGAELNINDVVFRFFFVYRTETRINFGIVLGKCIFMLYKLQRTNELLSGPVSKFEAIFLD